MTRYLTNYFASKNTVAKFYFVVDRLDLLEQSKQEFEARGLTVKTANNKDELMKQFRTNQSMEGNSGNLEITVVNIQRFAEDMENVDLPKYATNLQRIFIIDEAHRGYKPAGSFLSNLFNADKDSIKIALTGTPILKEERESWKVFGDYIHTYYYDKSIQDGYTLKIIREDIETSYRENLIRIYDDPDILVQKKDIKKSYIIEHDSYVKELTKYIIEDLKIFRLRQGDDTLGGMVVCETSTQAKKIFKIFDKVQKELNQASSRQTDFKVGLILHDSEDPKTRNQIVNDFKKNMTIDILIVYNMLLTGFDAPRLKRLYVARKLEGHNLLQAITRVNRPYKDNRYGFIIDFADIKKNFEETNQAYLKELERFNEVDENTVIDTFNYVLEDREKLISKIVNLKDLLFNYTTDNLEDFSSEISAIEDKKVLLELKNALTDAKDCFNIVMTFGDDNLKEKFKAMQIDGLLQMISEVSRRINIINFKMASECGDMKHIIDEAMLNIEFSFTKTLEEELKIGSKHDLNDKLQKTKRKFEQNFDPADPEFITIREAFRRRFIEKGFSISSVQDFKENSNYLVDIFNQLAALQQKNDDLIKVYNDEKFARIHKRIREENQKSDKCIISSNDDDIEDVLCEIKSIIDENIYNNKGNLNRDAYFGRLVESAVTQILFIQRDNKDDDGRQFIIDKIKQEYLNQYNKTYAM